MFLINIQAWQLVEQSRDLSLRRSPSNAWTGASLLRRRLLQETARNAEEVTMDWRFTTEDAGIKLKHLYPSIRS